MPPQRTDSNPVSLVDNTTGGLNAASSTPIKNINQRQWHEGLFWALLSPLFLGSIPILAKLAYATGADVLTVVAVRTVLAALMLWLALLIFNRKLVTSSKPAIYSSLLAGIINGIGSLFFYASLTRIDASLGQLINITYLVYVTVLLRLAGHSVSWLTAVRTGLAILSIYILTAGGIGHPDWLGVGMMVFAAFTFAIQLVLSQRILIDVPAPTVAAYIMSGMALVVVIAWFIFPTDLTIVTSAGWQAVVGMGIATGLSRLTLFLGVKRLGSIQAALLNVLEVIVSIVLALIFLDETLTLVQIGGAAVLLISILLVRYERDLPRFIDWWQIIWRWRLGKK
jgi:drug/metabolite transporter (DMT)-like permease